MRAVVTTSGQIPATVASPSGFPVETGDTLVIEIAVFSGSAFFRLTPPEKSIQTISKQQPPGRLPAHAIVSMADR
jgi:hypothetical protein